MNLFNKKGKFNVQGLRRKGTKNKVIAVFAAICLFVFIVALSGKVLLSSLTSSVYNITDLNNLDNVNVGDTINYSINGYSNWKVLSVDKENGTVDVTSSTNVKNLTMQPYKTVDQYNALFQAEADRFLDNNYVVSARTINKADALTFTDESNEEYWLANVNENTLMTNKTGNYGSAIWTKNTLNVNEIYVVPYIGLMDPFGQYTPSVGSTIDYSIYGIDRWIYTGQLTENGGEDNSINDVLVQLFVPETPIRLEVNSVDDIPNVVNNYFNGLLSAVRNDSNVYVCNGSTLNYPYLSINDLILLYQGQNYFDNKDIKMLLVESNMRYRLWSSHDWRTGNTSWNESSSNSDVKINYSESTYNTEVRYSHNMYFIDSEELNRTTVSNINNTPLYSDYRTTYKPKSLTFGYRPVLKLRAGGSNTNTNTNKVNSNDAAIKVGDYVNYEANDYKNWRVLSIDRENGTVDIVSGGIVKNLSLYGKDDYDNYEDILQREVNAYKNGDNVISARAILDSDIEPLNALGDGVGGLYWYNKKTQRRLDDHWDLQISNINSEISYNVGVLHNNGNSIDAYMVRLYSHAGSLPDTENVERYLGSGDLSYIAGLRPIITIKSDAVKVLPKEQVTQIVAQTGEYNQSYIATQRSSNKGSKLSIISGSSYSGGTGSDYYDYDYDDIMKECDANAQLKNVVLDIGKSNNYLKITFILSFIYRAILIGACTYAGYRLIKRKII